MATIGDRARTAMRSAGFRQKQLAERVGMTPDALSRALNDQRGFAAVELAAIATELNADVHELITGFPDPHRLVLSARHSYDHETGTRSVDGLDGDGRSYRTCVSCSRRQERRAPGRRYPQMSSTSGSSCPKGSCESSSNISRRSRSTW